MDGFGINLSDYIQNYLGSSVQKIFMFSMQCDLSLVLSLKLLSFDNLAKSRIQHDRVPECARLTSVYCSNII